MIDAVTQVTVGGMVVLLVLREVFGHLQKRRETNGDGRIRNVQESVDAILVRLDRIIDRLDDVADATKSARKQAELTQEQTERVTRAIDEIQSGLGRLARST